MRFSKRRTILVVLSALLLGGVVTAAALTAYLNVSNTFTVGNNLTVPSVNIAYDGGAFTGCTAGTFPAFTCPNPVTTVFAGDVVSYQWLTESDRASLAPLLTVSAGADQSYITTATKYEPCTTNTFASCTGGFTVGLPTMSAGSWYLVQADNSLGVGIPTGPVTLNLQFGTS